MQLLKLRAVLDRTGLSESNLYKKMLDGEFARPVKVSAKAVAWVEAEVDQWIADRIAARDEKPAARRRTEVRP